MDFDTSLASAEAPRAPISAPPSAPPAGGSPSLTGCVSTLSSHSRRSRAYAAAVRDYATAYSAFQAYLSPPARRLTPSVEPATAGELAARFDSWALPCLDAASDDEIEACGYLGWLNH